MQGWWRRRRRRRRRTTLIKSNNPHLAAPVAAPAGGTRLAEPAPTHAAATTAQLAPGATAAAPAHAVRPVSGGTLPGGHSPLPLCPGSPPFFFGPCCPCGLVLVALPRSQDRLPAAVRAPKPLGAHGLACLPASTIPSSLCWWIHWARCCCLVPQLLLLLLPHEGQPWAWLVLVVLAAWPCWVLSGASSAQQPPNYLLLACTNPLQAKSA